MLSKLASAATYGVSAFLVEIETHIEGGLFNFSVVGLPDNAVKGKPGQGPGRNQEFQL